VQNHRRDYHWSIWIDTGLTPMDEKITFNEPGKKITEKDIVELEQRLEMSLPSDYRQFLLRVNGGQPEPNAFPIRDSPRDTHGLLDRLFSVDDKDTDYDILDNAEVFRDRVPSDLLPIAFDPGGNLICLAVRGENRGKIYFWDHNNESLPRKTSDYHNVYFVANDFTELIDNLSELPE
jgi:cell wall assembly regulator SMI1